jgi:hypothetical protein
MGHDATTICLDVPAVISGAILMVYLAKKIL